MEIKVKDELISKLVKIRDDINGITVELGRVELESIDLGIVKDKLKTQYELLLESQQTTFKLITTEYGEGGVLDINKGVINTDDSKN